MIVNTLVWRTRVVSPDLLLEAQAGAKAPVSLRVLVENVLEFQKIVKTVMRLLIVKLELDLELELDLGLDLAVVKRNVWQLVTQMEVVVSKL